MIQKKPEYSGFFVFNPLFKRGSESNWVRFGSAGYGVLIPFQARRMGRAKAKPIIFKYLRALFIGVLWFEYPKRYNSA